MLRRRRNSKSNAGFTLIEVMITMFLISMMCLSVFAALQQITKGTLAVALRNEAHHHLQQEAERLLSTEYSNFVASGNTTITSAVKTSYSKSTVNPLLTTTDNAVGRVTFTRRVVAVSSTTTSRTLQVEVSWQWPKNGQTHVISVPLLRNQ